MSNFRTALPLVIGGAVLLAAAGCATTGEDPMRQAAAEAIHSAREDGADQWTHTDMVLAEESFRIGNNALAKERADTAREKTAALKAVPGLSVRLGAVETTASAALSTAQRAEATAGRAEANSLSALDQARQADLRAKEAKEAAERVAAAPAPAIKEGTLSSSNPSVGRGAPGAFQDTALKDAYFDYDSSALRADARDALLTNAQWLKANPDVGVTIEGHCDERGTSEYNVALGERRAVAARDILVAAGVAPERISTVSYGKERPFVIGHDESAWRWNRRAHFVAGTAPAPRMSSLR